MSDLYSGRHTLTGAPYYLQAENDRNTHNGMLYIQLIQRAFGADEVVMVGHHFVFEPKADMQALNLHTLNEIPSADTMLFDHDIMGAVFGNEARFVMAHLAMTPRGDRDTVLAAELAKLPAMVQS
jgi:hypothetical protein